MGRLLLPLEPCEIHVVGAVKIKKRGRPRNSETFSKPARQPYLKVHRELETRVTKGIDKVAILTVSYKPSEVLVTVHTKSQAPPSIPRA